MRPACRLDSPEAMAPGARRLHVPGTAHSRCLVCPHTLPAPPTLWPQLEADHGRVLGLTLSVQLGPALGMQNQGAATAFRGVSLGRNGLQAGELAVPMAWSTFGTHPAPQLSIPVGQRAARTSSGRMSRRVVMGSGPGDVRVNRLGQVPMLLLYWGPGGPPSYPRPGRGYLRPWSQRWVG